LKNLSFEVEELTIERQCDNIFIEKAADAINRMMSSFLLDVVRGFKPIAERYSKPVMQALIRSSSVFSRKGLRGRKNALPAVNAFSMNMAAYAP